MRFLNFFSALAALFVKCASTSPVNTSSDKLPILDPNSPTYETDLALVISYARHLPTTPVALAVQCGIFIDLVEHTNIPTYASSTSVCINTAPAQKMQDFMNWYCGFCIVFDEAACHGAIRWSGGPSKKGEGDVHGVRGARSYFCY